MTKPAIAVAPPQAILAVSTASVHKHNMERDTPLHLAICSGSLPVVEELLKHGCDLLARNANGVTPVHLAAKSGNAELFSLVFRTSGEVAEMADNNG